MRMVNFRRLAAIAAVSVTALTGTAVRADVIKDTQLSPLSFNIGGGNVINYFGGTLRFLNSGTIGANPGNVGGGAGNDVRIDNISIQLDITGQFNNTAPVAGSFVGTGSIYAFDPFSPLPITEGAEIILLDLTAVGFPATKLRESATKRSFGALNVNGAGIVQGSFFDVFFELTVNGTAVTPTWFAENQSETGTRFAPEPATIALFGFGLAGLGFVRRKRRKA